MEAKIMTSVAPVNGSSAETLPRTVDAAAVTALRLHVRRCAGEDAKDAAQWRADYLRLVARVLQTSGLSQAECAPLHRIADAVLTPQEPTEQDQDRRWAEEYAKDSATITYLIMSGLNEEEAAQRVAKELLARGVPLPEHGGDSRGWKRLLKFRERVRHGAASTPLAEIYRQTLDRLRRERRA
jgi:hypothetical protein